MSTVSSLSRCLNPRSIAVVGGREATRVVEQCRKMGFEGALYMVNPNHRRLAGLDCHASVEELPEAPDAAFVAIPAEASIAVIAGLAAMGAGGAVCYASGFSETGQSDLNDRLVAAAGSMPVIGPNCYGYINAMNGAALWPDQHGLGRLDPHWIETGEGAGVAVFSCSGNVSVNITMQQRSLPLALIVSVGNQAQVGITQCLKAVVDDPRIRAIGLHIEGLQCLSRFVPLAERAAQAGKTIVALKVGRSEIGARITMSHTATLAGQEALYDSLFQRLGIAVVRDVETFLETLKLAAITGPVKGPNIGSLSCSGGEASLIADLSSGTSIRFPELAPVHAKKVASTLNEFVSIDNPLDYHTFIWGDRQAMEATFTAMLEGEFDLTLLILDYPATNDCNMEEWIDAGMAFANACQSTGRPGAVVSTMVENMPRQQRDQLIRAGVVPMQGLTEAVAAIAALIDAGKSRGRLPQPRLISLPADTTTTQPLSEYHAKQRLVEFGVVIPRGELVTDPVAAVRAANAIGMPVVMKASSTTLLHKTESRAVVVGVDSDKVVAEECARLLELADSVLVEEMVRGTVVELLAGIASDTRFGQYLVIGSGGVLAEMLADRQILLLPVDDEQIRAALRNLGCARLLHGYRGAPGADIDAIVSAIRGLVDFARVNAHSVIEAEINPLMVAQTGGGAIAADALIVQRIDSANANPGTGD